MAFSLGDYLKNRYWSHVKDHGIVIADMVIQKALIAAPRGPQLLQASMELRKSERCAKCIFSTVDVSFPCFLRSSVIVASLNTSSQLV